MNQTEVTLFYSNNCGYCHQFRNESWGALTKFFDQNNVKWNEYEYGSDKTIVEQAKVDAFPTIRVTKGTIVEELVGLHDAGEIIAMAMPDLEKKVQEGGSQLAYWEHKREKYLSKLKRIKKN